MMAKKYVFGVLLTLSVLGNFALLYGSLDQAVAIDDCTSEVTRRGRQLEAATKLFRPVVKGQSSTALLTIAKNEKLEILPKVEDEIYIEQIKISVREGKISDFSFE